MKACTIGKQPTTSKRCIPVPSSDVMWLTVWHSYQVDLDCILTTETSEVLVSHACIGIACICLMDPFSIYFLLWQSNSMLVSLVYTATQMLSLHASGISTTWILSIVSSRNTAVVVSKDVMATCISCTLNESAPKLFHTISYTSVSFAPECNILHSQLGKVITSLKYMNFPRMKFRMKSHNIKRINPIKSYFIEHVQKGLTE